MTQKEYSDDELVAQLQQVKDEHGKVTPRLFNSADDTASASIVMRRFGSWTAAKENAGIEEDLHSSTGRTRKYSDEDILEHIRICAERHNGRCTVRQMQAEDDLVTPSVIVDRFGSWQEAKIEAGLDIDERSGNSRPREYTDEEYLDLLRDCHEEHGKVTQRLFNKRGKQRDDHPTAGAVRKRFGSWSEAKKQAGLETDSSTYSDDELLKQLRECAERHGRCSASVFASDDDFASPETVQRRFGGWTAGKEEAGLVDDDD